ncbi:hypothetical protein L1049_002006 [Liquidambar formosana]|uniref:Uncharacterized protein n=1 Tax=Liquidambar formosana TaxID=63359 RepID=A0AAP0NF66_LIQFO
MDQSTPLPPPSLHENGTTRRENSKTESSKDDKMVGCEAEDQKQSSKSFWRFKRSSSLNCGSGYGPSLCPLPLLSRSNSTGSASSVKRSSLAKDGHNQKQHPQKNSVKPSQSWFSGSCQKPPLKKGYGAYGNGVHINPVLHVPSASLFGFGSIFSNGRDKNKKK